MARPASRHPTELELQILKILWQQSPLPVRDVRDELETGTARRKLTHSSVITILNIMVRKKYLKRVKEGKAFFYTPRVSESRVNTGILRTVVRSVFDGSPSALLNQLLEATSLNQEELKEMRRAINRKVSAGK